MAGSLRSDSMEEFKGLRITSLDDEEQDIVIDEDDEDDDDDDEENEDVFLGFVKKPKNPRSLLRNFFPSKAGGVPVCYQNSKASLLGCYFFFCFSFFGLNLILNISIVVSIVIIS